MSDTIEKDGRTYIEISYLAGANATAKRLDVQLAQLRAELAAERKERESAEALLETTRSERRGLLGLVRVSLERYAKPDMKMLDLVATVCDRLEAAEKLAAEREADTRRRCIEIAEQISTKHWKDYKHGENRADPHYQGLSDGASEVAEAIRAMQESAGRQG